MSRLHLGHWLLCGILAAALLLGLWRLDKSRQQVGYDRAIAAQAVKDRQAESAERAKEASWQTKIDEVSNGAQKQIDTLQTELDSAGRAADRLRSAAKIAASRARENPGAADAGATTSDPIGVLADVLGELDERAGIYAEAADRSRIAGAACVTAYDALNSR